jgi:hypothetical protein
MRSRGFESVSYQTFPDPGVVGHDALLFSYESLAEPKDFSALRESYPSANLICYYNERSVAGYHSIAVLLKQHDIKFIRPGIGIESLLDLLSVWFSGAVIQSKPLIGVFSAVPGAGGTSVAALLGKQIDGVMLGLNLFNPGWSKPSLTLDQIRLRLSQKNFSLQDLKKVAVDVSGLMYLPGNADPLVSLDFTEDEIEHLIETICNEKTVIGDFGAIPHSAAWTVGVQRSSIRIMVAHPDHELQLQRLMQLSSDLGVDSKHWFLVGNKLRSDDLPVQSLARTLGMQTLPLASLSVRDPDNNWILPLSKKEQELLIRTTSLFE